MKHLLLFFQNEQSGSSKHLLFIAAVVCLPGTYGSKSFVTAKEYVSFTTGSSEERIKNLLFLNPKNTGQISCQKQEVLNDFCMHFWEGFNVDIQRLATNKALVSPCLFLPQIHLISALMAGIHVSLIILKDMSKPMNIFIGIEVYSDISRNPTGYKKRQENSGVYFGNKE